MFPGAFLINALNRVVYFWMVKVFVVIPSGSDDTQVFGMNTWYLSTLQTIPGTWIPATPAGKTP